MTKTQKLERKVTLLSARLAAEEGRHEDARTLFATCGISYVSPAEHAIAVGGN